MDQSTDFEKQKVSKEDILDAFGKLAYLLVHDTQSGNPKAGHALGLIRKAIAQYDTTAAIEFNQVINQLPVSGIIGKRTNRFGTTPPKGRSTTGAKLKKVPAQPANNEKAAWVSAEQKLIDAANAGQIIQTDSLNDLVATIASKQTKQILSDYKKDGITRIMDTLKIEYDASLKPMQLAALLRTTCEQMSNSENE